MFSVMGKRFCASLSSMLAGAAILIQQQQAGGRTVLEKIQEEHEQPEKLDELKFEIGKMIFAQYQKQMTQQNAQMEEVKKAFLASQQKMEKEFNGKFNQLEGKFKKLIEDGQQQRTIKDMNPVEQTGNNKVKNQMLEGKLENIELKNSQAISVNTPNGNRFIRSDKTKNKISPDGLKACTFEYLDIFAEKGFFISGKICRPLLYYFEVKRTYSSKNCTFRVGLSKGSLSEWVGESPNSYAIQHEHDNCLLSGTRHWFEWPNEAIKPEWNGRGDVVGCGILLNSKNELSIFFTLNGILLGRQIPIIHPAGGEHLYPTVGFRNSSLEANFGDDLSNPFKYDIKKCPGLIIE